MHSEQHGTVHPNSSPWPLLYRTIVALAIGITVGLTVRAAGNYFQGTQPRPTLSPNDRSRFLTIWAFGDYGRFWIDDLTERPGWKTIDKIYRPDTKHYYSSKPPLFPVLLAFEYRFIKLLTGNAWSFDEQPAAVVRTLVLTANALPYAIFLVLLLRFLRDQFGDGWITFVTLLVAALATPLTCFNITLNNHTVAAYFVFFALYAFWPLFTGRPIPWLRAFAGGLCAGFSAACELPATGFVVLLGFWLLFCNRKHLLLAYLPAVALVAAAFFYTNYLVTGDFKPAYLHKDWYDYEGSYWNNPRGIDNIHPPAYVYLFHLTFGHHGVFSLTPVFLYTVLGWIVALGRPGLWRNLSVLTILLTLAVYTVYIAPGPLGEIAPVRRNFGGMTNGFRWSFWLIPLWILFLPHGLQRAGLSRAATTVALVLIAVSAASVFYGMRNPWSRPWIQELLFRYGYIGY